MITENILAVIIITFKYFLNTFGDLLKKICSPLENNWWAMTCGINSDDKEKIHCGYINI